MKHFCRTKRFIITFSFLLFFKPGNGQDIAQLTDAHTIFTAIMDRMMVKMDSAKKGITVEADFISQMVPHHEAAVEMAAYEIKYGREPAMIQLAKSILAEQTNEVQQMNLWLPNPFQPGTEATADYREAMLETMQTMMNGMPQAGSPKNVDLQFAMVMIPHHQAAIDMVKVFLKYATHQTTRAFAKHIISAEQVEIDQMKSFINNNP